MSDLDKMSSSNNQSDVLDGELDDDSVDVRTEASAPVNNKHVHGEHCNHDHDHDHNHSGYEPPNDNDRFLPADMTDDEKKRLETLQNLTPEQLQQVATMLAMQKQNQDPNARREMLRRRLHQKQEQLQFQRANKREKQRIISDAEQKRTEFEKYQANLMTARDATDNIDALVRDVEIKEEPKKSSVDENGEDVEDLDAVDDGQLNTLPSITGNQTGNQTDNQTGNQDGNDSSSKPVQKSGPQKTEKRGGRRGKKSNNRKRK